MHLVQSSRASQISAEQSHRAATKDSRPRTDVWRQRTIAQIDRGIDLGNRGSEFPCVLLLSNEGVEKPWTLRLLPFSLYLGYAFTPPKSFAWIVERSMRSRFVGIAQNSRSGPFSTAPTSPFTRPRVGAKRRFRGSGAVAC